MAKRKRLLTPSATTQSAKEARDDRVSRRAAAQDQRQNAETVRLQAVRDQARRDQITTLNAVNSPLLRLPAELRNMIFAHVYAGTRFYVDDKGFLKYTIELVGLSRVCRQTHAEASLQPYGLGVFDFAIRWTPTIMGLWMLDKFLGRLKPRQIEAMVSLEFTQRSITLNGDWHQTRPAAYWVAKLEDLHVSLGGLYSVEAFLQDFDISSLGPSD